MQLPFVICIMFTLRMTHKFRKLILISITLVALVAIGACSTVDEQQKTLLIGGIPDQDVSRLEERFGSVAEYLSDELGIDVKYVPMTDYSSLVMAFKNGDVMLGWFGGLTGVQARSFSPGSEMLVQRPRDKTFTSVFIAHSSVAANSPEDIKGTRFTFGSTNSTSGHLMPRSFLLEANIDPEKDFDGVPNFSGSHDLTWKLVESGSFETGVLNSAVWNRAVADDNVDESKVRVVVETDSFVDYHWLAHPDIDEIWGEGTTQHISDAFLGLTNDDELGRTILDLFETESFVSADSSDYSDIEEVARSLNMLQ
jgi:phosphonate transport system substrate-binding protein